MAHPDRVALDEGLAEAGEDIVLRRAVSGGSPVSATCRAMVRGYQPNELVGDVQQQDSEVILSPTPLIAQGWPGAGNGSARPQKGDRAIVQGFVKVVMAETAIMRGAEIVRIEMRVRGQAS